MLTAESFEIKVGEYAELLTNRQFGGGLSFEDGYKAVVLIQSQREFMGKQWLCVKQYHPKNGKYHGSDLVKLEEIVSLDYESPVLSTFKERLTLENPPPVLLEWCFQDLKFFQNTLVEYKNDVLYLYAVSPERVLAGVVVDAQIVECREYNYQDCYDEVPWFLDSSTSIGEERMKIRTLNRDLQRSMKDFKEEDYKRMY